MGVDQAWGHIRAGQVHFFFTHIARAHPGNHPGIDGNVRGLDLAGEDIDHPAIAQHKVRGQVTAGDSNQIRKTGRVRNTSRIGDRHEAHSFVKPIWKKGFGVL